MNTKDIALTVGGVLATMVVAYLIYKMQQRDAAAAAAAASSAADTAAAYSASEAGGGYDEYAAAIASIQSPVTTGTSTTPANVSSSADTATTGDSGTSVSGEDGFSLIAQVLNDYASSLAPGPAAPGPAAFDLTGSPLDLATLTIPTIGGAPSTALANIPVTAADAAVQAAVPGMDDYTAIGEMLDPVTGRVTSFSNANFPPSMLTSYAMSSHPVTAHPITSTGA
jgi:hypothetical protein